MKEIDLIWLEVVSHRPQVNKTLEDHLARHYNKYYRSVAASNPSSEISFDDALSDVLEASVQLMREYNPDLGSFEAFSAKRLAGSIYDGARKRGNTTRYRLDKAKAREEAVDSIMASLGRKPTTQEIEDELGIDTSYVPKFLHGLCQQCTQDEQSAELSDEVENICLRAACVRDCGILYAFFSLNRSIEEIASFFLCPYGRVEAVIREAREAYK